MVRLNLIKNINLVQYLFLIIWTILIIFGGVYPDFINHGFMSITMLFGSFIAGATSEGGGAVAFPVMTLIFKIAPSTARDFSILIQSFGMTSASYLIISKRITIAKKLIGITLIGSFIGQILGFEIFEGNVLPATLKIAFTSIWMSFALVLFLQLKKNNENKDIVFTSANITLCLLFSFFGGIITALTGSGVDIFTFSIAVLYFRISEIVATPTSVVIMAINSVFACLLKYLFYDGISEQAYAYWLVCLPVVIFGAPIGAAFINKRSKMFIIYFLQVSIILQFIYSWLILDLSFDQKVLSILLLLGGFIMFFLMSKKKPSRQGGI